LSRLLDHTYVPTHSVRISELVISSSQIQLRTQLTTQETNIHALSGIRTHSLAIEHPQTYTRTDTTQEINVCLGLLATLNPTCLSRLLSIKGLLFLSLLIVGDVNVTWCTRLMMDSNLCLQVVLHYNSLVFLFQCLALKSNYVFHPTVSA